ncbi:MAG TPA: YbaB/EbfC family nucleoid-associated protein [Desulfobacterales bacterium]|jgi:DNA-binding YbaB/EbfC family protein
MKGMGNMMKQAQKLQAKMMKLQEELAEKTVETTAGGGMVKVVANGKQQILSIEIDREVVDPEDIEMLQDLVLAAVNDALAKAQEMVSSEMSKLTGGMNIPGLV